MKVLKVKTNPIEGQKFGTSGLRKKTKLFMSKNFVENFVQSIFNVYKVKGKTLVIGGDGRYYNDAAAQKIIRMSAANGVKHLIVGQNCLLTTPAASAIIRKYKAYGGIILSASHNAGGPNADFGIKCNTANGGIVHGKIGEAIYAQTKKIKLYKTCVAGDVNLSKIGETSLGKMKITIIDSVADYTELMSELFDFEALKKLFKKDFKICFDAMNASTGPYAKHIFEEVLGAKKGSVINSVPLPDFGNGHPDPNPTHCKELVKIMSGKNAPDAGFACDGDGDRNMILGKDFFVSPSDSVAVLVANASVVPAYKNGLAGVSRSMPTSAALDAVAKKLGIKLYEVPTGWKFFGSLMEAGKITICGEESFSTGGSYIREKDGIWAVLFWLSILAKTKKSVKDIVTGHWKEYGRNFYARNDYENLSVETARNVFENMRSKLETFAGKSLGKNKIKVKSADEYTYIDPIDKTVTKNQGIRVFFEDGSRIIYRLSDTIADGAIIRVYLDKFEKDVKKHAVDTHKMLAELADISKEVSDIKKLTGKTKPDVIV